MKNDKRAVAGSDEALARRSSTAGSVPGEAQEGWDPWETWLRRIDQPRRSRAETNWWQGLGISLHERRDVKHRMECRKYSIRSLFSKTLDTLGRK